MSGRVITLTSATDSLQTDMVKERYDAANGTWYEVDDNDQPVKTTPKRSGESRSGPECKKNSYAFVGAEFGDGLPSVHKDVRYVCWAPEKCPTTGRAHTQFYVYFLHHKTLSAAMKWLKKHWGFTSPVKMAEGTPEQNRIYCGHERYEREGKVKEANPEAEELGVLPQQGVKKTLKEAADLIKSGKMTADEMAMTDEGLYHQYGRTLTKIEDIHLRKQRRRWMTRGLWLWGDSGGGKSWFCDHVGAHAYWWEPDGDWWEDYTGQEIIVINELRGEIKFQQLLTLVDEYPKRLRRRNRPPMPCLAKLVIVTCTKSPEELYKNVKEDWIQFTRRFNVREIGQWNAIREGVCNHSRSSHPVRVTRCLDTGGQEKL